MYNNIGLRTPRGSGTNGYIQTNLAHISRPREEFIVGLKRNPNNSQKKQTLNSAVRHKKKGQNALKTDPKTLDHEKNRRMEALVFKQRCKFEELGMEETLIELKLKGYREQLAAKMSVNESSPLSHAADKSGTSSSLKKKGGITDLQNSHEMSEEKKRLNQRMLDALSLKEDEAGQVIEVTDNKAKYHKRLDKKTHHDHDDKQDSHAKSKNKKKQKGDFENDSESQSESASESANAHANGSDNEAMIMMTEIIIMIKTKKKKMMMMMMTIM
ncbi:hypothetical protein RFI_27584, partial [Reticulomyxa filosa]